MKVAIKREQSDACIGFVECEQTRHKAKWTVLSDNRNNDISLCIEHGLSILLETERHKILLDTGASDVFIQNAELLGVKFSDVDYVFISHGHSDHAGGLRYFLEHNRQAQVIVSPDAMSGKFFSKRGNLHSITTEWPEIDDNRLILIDQTCEIARYPQTQFYTSHCTDNNVFKVMKGVMGEQLQSFCAGTINEAR